MLYTYVAQELCLNDFDMVPIAPIVTDISYILEYSQDLLILFLFLSSSSSPTGPFHAESEC